MSKEEGKGEMGKGEREKGLPAKFATLLYTDISFVTYSQLPNNNNNQPGCRVYEVV